MPPPIQRQVIDSTDFSLGGAWSAELYRELAAGLMAPAAVLVGNLDTPFLSV